MGGGYYGGGMGGGYYGTGYRGGGGYYRGAGGAFYGSGGGGFYRGSAGAFYGNGGGYYGGGTGYYGGTYEPFYYTSKGKGKGKGSNSKEVVFYFRKNRNHNNYWPYNPYYSNGVYYGSVGPYGSPTPAGPFNPREHTFPNGDTPPGAAEIPSGFGPIPFNERPSEELPLENEKNSLDNNLYQNDYEPQPKHNLSPAPVQDNSYVQPLFSTYSNQKNEILPIDHIRPNTKPLKADSDKKNPWPKFNYSYPSVTFFPIPKSSKSSSKYPDSQNPSKDNMFPSRRRRRDAEVRAASIKKSDVVFIIVVF